MGTEKNAITIINNINKEKYELSVAIINVKENLNHISLDKENIYDLGSKRALFSLYGCYKIIKKLKPDIVFSFMHHINIVVGLTRLFNFEVNKFIARESNIPSLDNQNLKFSKFQKLLYKLFYKYFDVVICQSQEMQDDIISYAGIPKEKTIIISNAIDVEKIQNYVKDIPDIYNNKCININKIIINNITTINVDRFKEHELKYSNIYVL